MSWLRAFPVFRDLEARYKSQEGVIQNLRKTSAALTVRISVLRKQLKASDTRNHELIERIDEARKSEVHSTQVVADFVSQLKYGRKIYDHVPELPETAPEIPFEGIRKSRPQARDLVAQAEREFLESLNPPKKEPTQ